MAGLKRPIGKAGPDVVKIMTNLEKGLSGDRVTIVQRSAQSAKETHLAELGKATSTFRLRNVGKNGARVGVRYKVRKKGYAMAEGLIMATGPMQLLENKLAPHEIYSKESRVLTVFGKHAGFYTRVNHPGVKKNKEPWKKGYKRVKPGIQKDMRKGVFTTVKANYKL